MDARMTVRQAIDLIDKDESWKRFQVGYPEATHGALAIVHYSIGKYAPERIRRIKKEGPDRDTGWGQFRKLVEFGVDENGDVPVEVTLDENKEIKSIRPLKQTLWMSDTRAEILEHNPFWQKMFWADSLRHKRILINGLGLGVVVHGALTYNGVDHIDVVEQNEDIIALIGPYLADPRVTIHHADAYDIRWSASDRWDYAWHDIWPNISDENIPEMDRLMAKYKRRVSWQDCWQRKGCFKMKHIFQSARNGKLDPHVALEILGGKFHL